jgi:hypothetical protein
MLRVWWLIALLLPVILAHKKHTPVATIVTGLWSLNSSHPVSPQEEALRHDFIQALLQSTSNLIIFGSKSVRNYVETHRNRSNLVVIERNEDYFENKWFAPQLKALSKSAAELTEQQDSILPSYSKLSLMNEARTYDIF